MKEYIDDKILNHTMLLLEHLERWRIIDCEKILEIKYLECEYKKGSERPMVDNKWKKLSTDLPLRGKDTHFWLYFKFTMPQRFIGKNVYLKLFPQNEWADVADQHLVYINDKQVCTYDYNHSEIKLDNNQKEFEVYIYSYSGLSVTDYFTGEKSGYVIVPNLQIVEIDQDTENLYYDLKVLEDISQYTDKNTKEYFELTTAIQGAKKLLDLRQPKSEAYFQSIKAALDYLKNGIYANGNFHQPKVACVGHTHIDIAWLWTVGQTREKAQRSFATVIELMKQHPEYKFSSSQPILYQMVKEEAPKLYEEIKQRVKEGRWEAEGGMWLGADCN